MQTALDSLDDELTTDDIVTRERAIDKEFIMLIQAACKADNIPRAIELTKLLHHLTSFDAAMKIAEFYHLIGFKEKVEMLKNEREEGEERAVLARNKRRRWLKPDQPARQIVATNGVSSSSRYDPLSDVRPPPTIERPGMARVTVPIIEKTRYTSAAPASQTPERTIVNDTSSFTESPTSLDKRKRTEMEDSFPGSDLSMPPPKQSKHYFLDSPFKES
jgi:chromosome transmission fidelity protein 4